MAGRGGKAISFPVCFNFISGNMKILNHEPAKGQAVNREPDNLNSNMFFMFYLKVYEACIIRIFGNNFEKEHSSINYFRFSRFGGIEIPRCCMIEQHIEIVFNNRINSDTFLMGLRSPEIVKAARPGQFVMIRVRAGSDPLLRRPFSICGIRDDLFLVLYRVVGQGTAIMAEIREGERLSVLGPLGVGFDVPKSEQVPLLVAGGIGIAPLFFLAQSMKTCYCQIIPQCDRCQARGQVRRRGRGACHLSQYIDRHGHRCR